MTQPQKSPPDKTRPFLEESDIGSGEKTPAQVETEEMIREIPPLPRSQQAANAGARQGGESSGQPDQQEGSQPSGNRQSGSEQSGSVQSGSQQSGSQQSGIPYCNEEGNDEGASS